MKSRESNALPTYLELLERIDAPPGSSWGLFGPNDELGTANFLTPERVVAAAANIRSGKTFNLDCSMGAFDPPTSHQRRPMHHTIFGNNPHHRDDWLDAFYLQSGSQIDALRHMRHPVHGFYNRVSDDSIAVGNPALGISRWAEKGLVGRGVLIDLDRHYRQQGRTIDHSVGEPIPISTLDQAAREQGTVIREGDILLIRTGWLRFYFDELDAEGRRQFPQRQRSAGLLQSRDTLAWLWDRRIAVCAADNIGVEAIPPAPESPFSSELKGVRGVSGDIQPRLMHPHLIAMLGLVIGELLNLDALAADCESDGRWESFVTIKPLNLIGGVGSPANCLAIK
jgi:kynurenine formamidase